MAGETRVNVGHLVNPFAPAYGKLSIVVPRQHSFVPHRPFIVHMTFVFHFEYVLGYLN